MKNTICNHWQNVIQWMRVVWGHTRVQVADGASISLLPEHNWHNWLMSMVTFLQLTGLLWLHIILPPLTERVRVESVECSSSGEQVLQSQVEVRERSRHLQGTVTLQESKLDQLDTTDRTGDSTGSETHTHKYNSKDTFCTLWWSWKRQLETYLRNQMSHSL